MPCLSCVALLASLNTASRIAMAGTVFKHQPRFLEFSSHRRSKMQRNNKNPKGVGSSRLWALTVMGEHRVVQRQQAVHPHALFIACWLGELTVRLKAVPL